MKSKKEYLDKLTGVELAQHLVEALIQLDQAQNHIEEEESMRWAALLIDRLNHLDDFDYVGK